MLKYRYHYTSLANYKIIEKKELVPYVIQRPELNPWFKNGLVYGIWLWDKELRGKSELGAILFQVATKCSVDIVKLKILSKETNLLYYTNECRENKLVELYHTGSIGDWDYHCGKERAVICTEPIHKKYITLIKQYNLEDILW